MEGLAVGRIIHVVERRGEHNAAIVTQLLTDPGCIQATVFRPGGETTGVYHMAYDDSPDPPDGTWHWIERA